MRGWSISLGYGALLALTACGSQGPDADDEAALSALTGIYSFHVQQIKREHVPAPGESGPCVIVNGTPTCSGFGRAYAVIVTSGTLNVFDAVYDRGSFPGSVWGELPIEDALVAAAYVDQGFTCDGDMDCMLGLPAQNISIQPHEHIDAMLTSDGGARLRLIVTFEDAVDAMGFTPGAQVLFDWSTANSDGLEIDSAAARAVYRISKVH